MRRLCAIPVALWIMALLLMGCVGSRPVKLTNEEPYPTIEATDSTAKFGDVDDSVLIEVRKKPISGPLKNLAIHYAALFPDAQVIRRGDSEAYLTVKGKNAYKVTFQTTYIRNRKRFTENTEIPPGWRLSEMDDADTGKTIPIIYGPIIPRQKVLYLVEGEKFVYYIFMRADGETIGPAKKQLETFVTSGINYE